MFSPRRGRLKYTVSKLGKTLLGAIGLAALIVMLLTPGLPPEQKSDELPPMINMDLVSALSSRSPAQLVYNEQQVNSYLSSAVRKATKADKQGFIPVRRIVANFEEGLCHLNVEQSVFGLSIYCGSGYSVTLDGGKITSRVVSGYIGRMPIHPRDELLRNLFPQCMVIALPRTRPGFQAGWDPIPPTISHPDRDAVMVSPDE